MQGALVIGSSAAALQAASDLADAGVLVHLVEHSPFLGNVGNPSLPKHVLKTKLLEIAHHPKIRTYTNAQVNEIKGDKGNFQVHLSQQPRYVDLEKCTGCGDCISVCPVVVPGSDHNAIFLLGEPNCAAITKAGISPCANACPGGINVQGYVALIAQGKYQEAINLIRLEIPFPAICGRVCNHPCEINCRRNEVDQPVSIRLLKRFVSDWESSSGKPDYQAEKLNSIPNSPSNPMSNSEIMGSQKIAIIGAGPGGMTVADSLSRVGYPVTVFEKLPVIGGMMTVGIPEYRLPRTIIAREYQNILDRGVEVELDTSIGPGGKYTIEELFSKGYKAICLAIGAHCGQNLDIPGDNFTGIVHGIDLLKTISLARQLPKTQYANALKHFLSRGSDTRVIVLGGGNTAIDVSRSLKRLGLADVRIFYRRTKNEMPCLPEETEAAENEGISIEYLVSPIGFLGSVQQGVNGLRCTRMELSDPDSSGRRRPIPISGSEFSTEVDLVALAIGQSIDSSILDKVPSIAKTRDGGIVVDPITFMTGYPGIFAVGDAVTGARMTVIEAIGMGKKAASAIDNFLRQNPHSAIIKNVNIANRPLSSAEILPRPQNRSPLIPLDERIGSFKEVELGYTAEQASDEAKRCLSCGICSECLECAHVCKPNAIIHNQSATPYALYIGAIIHTSIDPPNRISEIVGTDGIYCLDSEDAISGSAAAALAMRNLVLPANNDPVSVTYGSLIGSELPQKK